VCEADQLNPSELRVRTRLARGAFHLDVDFPFRPASPFSRPSGAGKSTLLDCIAGLIAPDEGRITISNDLLFDSATHLNLPAQNRRLGYLFQSPGSSSSSAKQNIEFGISRLQIPIATTPSPKFSDSSASTISRRANLPKLSGGEAQRVALARALVT